MVWFYWAIFDKKSLWEDATMERTFLRSILPAAYPEQLWHGITWHVCSSRLLANISSANDPKRGGPPSRSDGRSSSSSMPRPASEYRPSPFLLRILKDTENQLLSRLAIPSFTPSFEIICASARLVSLSDHWISQPSHRNLNNHRWVRS